MGQHAVVTMPPAVVMVPATRRAIAHSPAALPCPPCDQALRA